MNKQKQQSGFTLVELLIVIAIVGIIASMAIPSFRQQIAQMKVKDTTSSIEMALKQARSDTLIHRAPVIFGIDQTAKQIITAQPVGNTRGCSITSTNNLASCKVVKYSFDEKVNITGTSVNKTVYFTANKRSYFGLPTDTTPEPIQPIATYSLCYEGISTDKYVVSLDTSSNIKVTKDGRCS